MPSRWCVFMGSVYRHLLPLWKQLISKGHKSHAQWKPPLWVRQENRAPFTLHCRCLTGRAEVRYTSTRQPLSHCLMSHLQLGALGSTTPRTYLLGTKMRATQMAVSREFWMPDHIGSPRQAEKEESPSPMLPSPLLTSQGEYRTSQAIKASVGQIKWTQLAEMMERFSLRYPNRDGPSLGPRPRGSAQHWRHWQMHYRKLHRHLIS